MSKGIYSKSVKNFVNNNRWLLLLAMLHLVISLIYSKDFFVPIKKNVGSENIAYTYLMFGETLQKDILSRLLCWTYSHLLGIVFIVVFWSSVLSTINVWKTCKESRIYIKILAVLIVCGVFLIIGLYPTTITYAPDTAYNYVYAREWLPMYWHGFLTNVVHCACLLFFPHPISLSVVPFLLAIIIFYYFTVQFVVKYSIKNQIRNALTWGVYYS